MSRVASIPEDMIMSHLNLLLTSSEPGATMHHLHVVAVPVSAMIGPLGVPDVKQLDSTIYAIAPDQRVDVEQFIVNVIRAAAVNAAEKGVTILFAALSQEGWAVDPMDELAWQLAREKRLHKHPDVVEVTVVYGVCRDGRRWRGRRWLTGPKASVTEDVDLLVGQPQPHEAPGIPFAPLLRRLVGMR